MKKKIVLFAIFSLVLILSLCFVACNKDGESGTVNNNPVPQELQTPDYTKPTLNAQFGQTLADVALPQGFTWDEPLTTSVGNVGPNTFHVTFTPTDTATYKTVTGIEVTITVSKEIKALGVVVNTDNNNTYVVIDGLEGYECRVYSDTLTLAEAQARITSDNPDLNLRTNSDLNSSTRPRLSENVVVILNIVYEIKNNTVSPATGTTCYWSTDGYGGVGIFNMYGDVGVSFYKYGIEASFEGASQCTEFDSFEGFWEISTEYANNIEVEYSNQTYYFEIIDETTKQVEMTYHN